MYTFTRSRHLRPFPLRGRVWRICQQRRRLPRRERQQRPQSRWVRHDNSLNRGFGWGNAFFFPPPLSLLLFFAFYRQLASYEDRPNITAWRIGGFPLGGEAQVLCSNETLIAGPAISLSLKRPVSKTLSFSPSGSNNHGEAGVSAVLEDRELRGKEQCQKEWSLWRRRGARKGASEMRQVSHNNNM